MSPRRGGMLLCVLLVVAACSGDPEVVVVPPDQVPFQVARTSPPSPRSTTRATPSVFFVRDGRLVEAARILPSDPASAEGVVHLLLQGPTEGEMDRGFETAIPPNVRLQQVHVFDGVAEVDMSAEFQSPAAPDEVLLRVAQVVWTLVALSNVDAVRFTIDGVPQAVVTDGGDVEDRPVTAPDYASVAPEGAGTEPGTGASPDPTEEGS